MEKVPLQDTSTESLQAQRTSRALIPDSVMHGKSPAQSTFMGICLLIKIHWFITMFWCFILALSLHLCGWEILPTH